MKMLEIADAHLHFWDLERNYYPWLCDADAPHHRYGNHQAIRRNYLPDDYRADSAGNQITETVHVEAVFDPCDPVAETRWLDELRNKTGMPTVAVARAVLENDDVEVTLASHSRFPFVRGIRHRLRLGAAPQGPAGPRAGFDNPKFRHGFALLEKFGMSCDVGIPFQCLRELAELAHDFPRTQIILNHCGNPFDRSFEGLETWRAGMTQLSKKPNVAVKISGIGVPGQSWTAKLNAPIILETLLIFGIDRCMFASNFPPDSLVSDFSTIVQTTAKVVDDMAPRGKEKLFRDNARRLYRIT